MQTLAKVFFEFSSLIDVPKLEPRTISCWVDTKALTCYTKDNYSCTYANNVCEAQIRQSTVKSISSFKTTHILAIRSPAVNYPEHSSDETEHWMQSFATLFHGY